MKGNYTETFQYKLSMACLAASVIMLIWNSFPSAEGAVFTASLSSLIYLTYKDIKKRNE